MKSTVQCGFAFDGQASSFYAKLIGLRASGFVVKTIRAFHPNVGLIMLTSRKELQVRDQDLSGSIPIDMTLDAGLRLDTRVGVFRLSIGNGLGRIPF